MSGLLVPDAAFDHAILLDEAGIETGVFGEFRLKSAYSAVFARQGEALVPVALAASLQPMLRGRRLPCRPFLARLGTADRASVNRIGTELHLRNCHNAGPEHLDLHLGWTGGRSGLDRTLPPHLETEEPEPLQITPARLVWQFPSEHDASTVRGATAGLQRVGCRIGLEGFGLRPEMLRTIAPLRPDIVAFDGGWFRRLASAPAAVLLFVRLVERLKQSGAQVMIAGIQTAAQLRVALNAEADLFQGEHLAPPALAGIPFDASPRRLSDLLQERSVVVPLFG